MSKHSDKKDIKNIRDFVSTGKLNEGLWKRSERQKLYGLILFINVIFSGLECTENIIYGLILFIFSSSMLIYSGSLLRREEKKDLLLSSPFLFIALILPVCGSLLEKVYSSCDSKGKFFLLLSIIFIIIYFVSICTIIVIKKRIRLSYYDKRNFKNTTMDLPVWATLLLVSFVAAVRYQYLDKVISRDLQVSAVIVLVLAISTPFVTELCLKYHYVKKYDLEDALCTTDEEIKYSPYQD